MPGGMLDLLIVEDHANLRRALRAGLAATGEVAAASGGSAYDRAGGEKDSGDGPGDTVRTDCASGEEAVSACLGGRTPKQVIQAAVYARHAKTTANHPGE
jgi:hypothetical protein